MLDAFLSLPPRAYTSPGPTHFSEIPPDTAALTRYEVGEYAHEVETERRWRAAEQTPQRRHGRILVAHARVEDLCAVAFSPMAGAHIVECDDLPEPAAVTRIYDHLTFWGKVRNWIRRPVKTWRASRALAKESL